MELNKLEKQKIENLVKPLLEQYGYSFKYDTYVDIVSFVRNLGFVVGTSKLPPNEDGFIIIQPDKLVDESKNINSDKIIGVNSDASFDWKRFVIAHEFAHSILHYKEGTVYLHRENKKGKSEEENDADYFAAALLMPKESFKREYDKLESSGLNRNAICYMLSSIFQTPFDSVSRRIDEVCS